MKINWKSVGKLALAVVAQAVPAVGTVEAVIEALPHASSSQEKQDLAATLIKASVQSVEGLSGKDLLNDAEVDKAARSVIDAVVSLKNVLAVKAALATATAAVVGSTGD